MKKYVICLVIFLFGIGAGRWLTPTEVITKTKIVEVMSQNEKINKKEVITIKKDGTKIIVRTYQKETKTKIKRIMSQKKTKKSRLNYGINVGRSFKSDKYLIQIDKQIIFNVNIGIYTTVQNMKFLNSGIYLRYAF